MLAAYDEDDCNFFPYSYTYAGVVALCFSYELYIYFRFSLRFL